jgi:hypothetical protein
MVQLKVGQSLFVNNELKQQEVMRKNRQQEEKDCATRKQLFKKKGNQ